MSILLEPYNPLWKKEFERIRQHLMKLLIMLPVDILHVGSTSIPGMIAKPILDIDVIPHKNELISEISEKLAAAGYINKGEQGIPGRLAFRQKNSLTPNTTSNDCWQEHHLYVCSSNCLALKNHLHFKDALIKNEEYANSYARLKKELVYQQDVTRVEYNRLKTNFILSVLALTGFDENELAEIKNLNI
jgi:GrpB-like predicted nucleotidyltransferase (UPF0157 family)